MRRGMLPIAAAGVTAGFDHSLIGLEHQWSDARQAGVVHLDFDKAEANARQELGNVTQLVERRAMGALLKIQAIQDAAFLRALDAAREAISAKAVGRAAVPIPDDWKAYKADLDKIARRFGAMSPSASDAVDTWIRSGVLDPSFAAGQRKAITARDLGGLTPYLQYVTRGDDRVRDNHAALDGFVAATSWDGWVEECGPPCGYNCRCKLIVVPWRVAIRLGFASVFPRGVAKLRAFRARGGADHNFPRGLFALGNL